MRAQWFPGLVGFRNGPAGVAAQVAAGRSRRRGSDGTGDVAANRAVLVSLLNLLGFNVSGDRTPRPPMSGCGTQDVAAMVGYHAEVVSALMPFTQQLKKLAAYRSGLTSAAAAAAGP